MNPINPVCRPATENEINYGEAKWCAKCTSECDSKGKDELVVCDYFKTNENDPIVPGCPSLMQHALPGGFDSFAPAEEGTQMPEPKEFAAREATREKPSRVGNAAKMREALSDACYAMFNFLKTQNGGYEEMAEALDKAKAALAEPPRNCDIGNALEQVSRHMIWCKCGGECAVSCKMCFAKWAQMPNEEGGSK